METISVPNISKRTDILFVVIPVTIYRGRGTVFNNSLLCHHPLGSQALVDVEGKFVGSLLTKYPYVRK